MEDSSITDHSEYGSFNFYTIYSFDEIKNRAIKFIQNKNVGKDDIAVICLDGEYYFTEINEVWGVEWKKLWPNCIEIKKICFSELKLSQQAKNIGNIEGQYFALQHIWCGNNKFLQMVSELSPIKERENKL